MNGKHIIFDGIDGSGKSTLLYAVRDDLVAQGKKVLDVKAYWQEKHTYPTAEDITSADVVVTAEPSTIWVGQAIRSEMIRTDAGYGPQSIAMAFAIDREIHYRRIILPARAAGKIVLQDRGVSSSLVYQPAQSAEVSLEWLQALPGNALALTHSPTALVIATLSAETAVSRLAARTEKQDDSFFERQTFLATLAQRFASDWLRDLFSQRGTNLHTINTDTDIDSSRTAATALFRSLVD